MTDVDSATPANASTALATVVVDELVRGGLREVVVAPGSRSAALAYAVHAAAQEDRLRLHVRIDERTAGFLALGLARTSRRPVAVVTTSGTAVANLHPAVVEAAHAGLPLVLLTADRPASLRGTGANQTTDQVKIFGEAVRSSADVPAAVPGHREAEQVQAWRSLVSRALLTGTGGAAAASGP
ncbi:MAG: 2-succinyl-5-enolpyruvyl-6-hydroxy-3-cyclohexene-carboxylate synthase, partial [Nocardioidaceae bacterium]|nr:2-succinyl-5-enolpyruvyl-6-hydroxy-3-cyclohexene-carboxylate synthase [Nocardioidaceae bacterium]